MPVRLRASLAVLLVGLCVGVVGVVSGGRLTAPAPGGAGSAAQSPAGRPAERFALGVLRGWDARRAAAWAAADPARLARLYTRRSTAGAADLDLLRRYRARGLVVRDMRMQLLRARVLTSRTRLVVLEVTDRLASAAAHATRGRTWPLPRDVATTHEVVLRRVGGEWRMARVSLVR